MAKVEHYLGTGKRKTSTARVYLKNGKGVTTVNNRSFAEYFPAAHLKNIAMQPLLKAGLDGQMDIKINVHGGGFKGQLAAIRHAIARALVRYNPELRSPLKKEGFLRRDARKKERKKYGQKGARARFQFSKR